MINDRLHPKGTWLNLHRYVIAAQEAQLAISDSLPMRGTPVTCVGLLLTTPPRLILPQALVSVSTARVLDATAGHTHPRTFVSPTFATTLPALCPALGVRMDPTPPWTTTMAVNTVFPTITKYRRYFLLTMDSKTRTSRTRSCAYFGISALAGTTGNTTV